MIGGSLFQFLPHPHYSSLCHPLKIPSIPGEHSFCPLLKGGASTHCISPECSFHGWLKIVTVFYPFQMMSGYMSWGTWILFMVQISIIIRKHESHPESSKVQTLYWWEVSLCIRRLGQSLWAQEEAGRTSTGAALGLNLGGGGDFRL